MAAEVEKELFSSGRERTMPSRPANNYIVQWKITGLNILHVETEMPACPPSPLPPPPCYPICGGGSQTSLSFYIFYTSISLSFWSSLYVGKCSHLFATTTTERSDINTTLLCCQGKRCFSFFFGRMCVPNVVVKIMTGYFFSFWSVISNIFFFSLEHRREE